MLSCDNLRISEAGPIPSLAPMPGRHYKHELTKGPYEGEDCRIVEETAPGFVRVKIRQVRLLLSVPLDWLRKKIRRKRKK